MIFCPIWKVYYVEIPRTGSASVAWYLDTNLGIMKGPDPHQPISRCPVCLTDYTVIATIRDPFERMVSMWSLAAKGMRGIKRQWTEFPDFVRSVTSQPEEERDYWIHPQTYFLKNPPPFTPDIIFLRTSHLWEDLKERFPLYSPDHQMQAMNQSRNRPKPWYDYYDEDPDLKDLVAEWAIDDLVLYDTVVGDNRE